MCFSQGTVKAQFCVDLSVPRMFRFGTGGGLGVQLLPFFFSFLEQLLPLLSFSQSALSGFLSSLRVDLVLFFVFQLLLLLLL